MTWWASKIASALAGTAPPADPLGPVDQDPDSVREAACRLVESRATCAPPKPPDIQPSNLRAPAGVLGAFLWLLLIAVVLALVYVIVRYFIDRQSSAQDGGQEDDADPDDDALVGTVVIDRTREPLGWREEAGRHRAAGRYRDALRCRYRALVGDLARLGLLDEIPGRTTGEERRQLRSSAPNAVPFFREGADLFDAAWYGALAVGASHDDRFQQIERDVLATAASVPHRLPRSYEAGRV